LKKTAHIIGTTSLSLLTAFFLLMMFNGGAPAILFFIAAAITVPIPALQRLKKKLKFGHGIALLTDFISWQLFFGSGKQHYAQRTSSNFSVADKGEATDSVPSNDLTSIHQNQENDFVSDPDETPEIAEPEILPEEKPSESAAEEELPIREPEEGSCTHPEQNVKEEIPIATELESEHPEGSTFSIHFIDVGQADTVLVTITAT